LITALQNNALIGSSGVKLSTAPTQVATGHCHGNRIWQVGPRWARLAV
jgi:hypothetical protein